MKRREQIRMSDAEVWAYLEEQRRLAVATNDRDGYPHVVAMWYALVDGQIAFWTYGKSQKVVNLRRDPRLTCLVESGDRYAELRGVQIKGRAVLADDLATVRQLGMTIHERYHGAPLVTSLREKVARQAPKRIAVFVQPVEIVSWDHRKLGSEY
jgi:PPOX class probable F420-dependent enzyme